MSDTRITRRPLNDLWLGKTDWQRIDRQTDAEIEQAVASAPDAAPILDDDWLARADVVPRGRLPSR